MAKHVISLRWYNFSFPVFRADEASDTNQPDILVSIFNQNLYIFRKVSFSKMSQIPFWQHQKNISSMAISFYQTPHTDLWYYHGERGKKCKKKRSYTCTKLSDHAITGTNLKAINQIPGQFPRILIRQQISGIFFLEDRFRCPKPSPNNSPTCISGLCLLAYSSTAGGTKCETGER